MSLPLIAFLYIYLFFVAVFFLGSIFVVYHILRFGFNRKLVGFIIGLYFAVALLILSLSAYYLLPINWSQTLKVNLPLKFL